VVEAGSSTGAIDIHEALETVSRLSEYYLTELGRTAITMGLKLKNLVLIPELARVASARAFSLKERYAVGERVTVTAKSSALPPYRAVVLAHPQPTGCCSPIAARPPCALIADRRPARRYPQDSNPSMTSRVPRRPVGSPEQGLAA
jgi:hypothetical protein